MYHNTMESEGRQKKVEAGREMFAAYLKKKNASGQQGEQRKKKKIKNETDSSKEVSVAGESLDSSPLASSLEDNEVVNLECSTQTNGTNITLTESKQSFEDGGEVSSERFQIRLRELEDILCSKEAALEATIEELSALKEITSFDVSTGMLETDYKTRFEECRERLLEFQEAVEHREGIIGQLSSSLQQAIQTRDSLQLQGDQLAQEVALLQRQLKATTELIQGHHWDTGIKPQDYLTLQNQVLALEAAVSRNESVIVDLNYIIKEKESALQSKSDELQKKSQELSQHKTKSASEIQNLMREVEELHQKCAITASNQSSLILEHEGQMAALQAELEENFGLQLAQIKEDLRNQFNTEKEALEKRHVDEIALCKTLAAQSSIPGEELTTPSKQQLESLHSQLQESSDAREKLVNEVAELKQTYVLEVESFKQKMAVLQEKLEEAAKEKQIYEQHVLESRKEIGKDLTVYKQQVENLSFRLQEASIAETKHSEQLRVCKKVYEAELSSYKQSHEMELTLYKEQIDNLNLQLQDALKAEADYSAKLVECKKACEAELASYQQSYEMELASYKQSTEALKLRLHEASVAEENFPKVLAAHKRSLEFEVCRYKEENEALNAELQKILNSEEILRKEKTEMLASHSVAVSSYEEQLATLKASLQAAEETVTYHERELSSLKKHLEDKSNAKEDGEVKRYKEQIVTLNTQLEQALEYGEKCKQDFALCKKSHEEEINLIKQNLESEQIQRNAIAKCQSHEDELALCRQQIEFLNSRLQDASEAEKCHVSEITACQVQLKEYKEQVDSLDRRFSEELLHAQEDFSKEMISKGLEIETLLARLQEASALEERYKSQRLSSQQEIENLNMQLQERAETEKRNTMEIVSYQEKLTAYSDEVQAVKRIAASQDELQTYKQQIETLKESLRYELSRLQDSHNEQLKRIEEEHAVQIVSVSNQVDDLTLQLGEVTKANEVLEKEKSTYHNLRATEIDEYKHQLEKFSAQLQENRKNEEKYVTDMSDCQKQLISYKSQVELLNAKIQDDMSEIKVLHTKEVNDLKDELQHLKNIKATLEAEVVCLNEAAKHRDDSSRAQLEEVTVQFLKTQGLLAAKEEVEEALESRINDLQIDLEKANQSIDHMKRENEQLQEMTVQYLKLEGLLAAKEEAERMLSEHVQDLEEALCSMKKDSEQMNQGSCQLTLKVAKAKELFKKLKYEKDELSEKYKQLEADRDQLVSEKKMTEEKLKDLASQVNKLKTSSSVDENVLTSGGSDLPPATDMCVGVVVTPLECASVADSIVSSGQALISGFDNTQVVNYSEDRGQISDSGPLKRRKRSTANVLEPVSSFCSSKLLEKLIVFEREKIELANQLETLESKFQEKELQERLCIEERSVAKMRCKELEEKLLQLEKVRIERDTILQEKNDLELKVVDLERENTTFCNLQTTLNIELAEEKMASEDKLHQGVKERLENIIDEKKYTTIENLILDLGNKAKEIVFLNEKLRSQEQTCQLLNEKILILEKSKAEDAKKINLCHEELARVHSELEESWKRHNATKEELGTSKKELTMLYIQKEQCESSRNRLLKMGTSHVEITPVCASSQEELHSMLKELVIEVETLKSSLEDEQNRNEKLTLELEMVQKSGSAAVHLGVTDVNSNDSSDSGMLELQHKLELILRSNTELVAEKETLLDKLRNQQHYIGKLQQAGGYEQVESWMSNLDKQQSDLMAELRAYREQHTSLAELVGSTGVLQETLYRQKHELLQKFEEKSAIEKMLEHEREELKSAQLKIQMMEQQMLEKDKIFQELTRQKRLLEQDLHEIEDRLRDQEDTLQTQKLALEAEIRDRDLHIRHWQLELRAKQVEVSSEKTLKSFDQQSTQSTTRSVHSGEQERLELLRSQLEEVHQQAVARLKLYMEEQFAIHETELQRNFTSEVSTLKQQHKEQLMSMQQQLDAKTEELEALLSSELHSQLGISQNLVTRLEAEGMAAMKEKQRIELDNVKNNLDEQHTEIYNLLRQKFEKFAEQQIAIALKVIQNEHESVHQRIVSNLIMKHTEELKVLQAKLESQRQEELLLLRQNLNQKHNDELNEVTKGLKLEISLLKQPHDSKFSRSSVHQLKQDMCMEYTSTLKGWVQTWYSDCQGHLEALNKQIYEVWQQEEPQCQKSGADSPGKISVAQIDIKRLLESKEQLLTQAEVLHTEVAKRHMQALHNLQTQLDAEHSKLVETVEQMKRTVQEGTTIASLQDQISKLTAEREELQNKHKLAVDLLSHEHNVEVAKLRDLIANVKCGNISGLTELRQEMEAKHAKEMEELRQYFEQKCADVEKHYSEEVFSQHSRKLSGSSSGLENEELVSDMYYAGGDHGQRLTALTHICDSYSVEPSFKDLEEHYRTDFEKRLVEYRDQLESVKLELEDKYQNEMEVLREEYESKVEDLVRDLSNTHKTEIQNIESKHAKEIQNLKEKLQLESAKELSNVHLECTNEIQKVQKEMADEHRKELERMKDMFEKELKRQIESLTYNMKQEEEERVAAIKSELLNKHVKDVQKLEDSFADHVVDEIGRTSTDATLQKVNVQKIQIDVRQQCEGEYKKKLTELRNDLQEKHAKELETTIEAERKLMTEQFDELTTVLKRSAEEEQDKFMADQKEMMSNFVKQHQQNLQALKIQHEASLQAVQEECQKLWEVQIQQLKDKHKQEIGALQEEIAMLIQEKNTCHVQVMSMAMSAVSADQTDRAAELASATAREMAALHTVQQLQDEIKDKDAKFASAIAEMKEMHESELDQVRAHCERRLHDEVEQAKHDISRSLEEQIQALLSNDCKNTPRPKELIELQEKFAVQYKQEVVVLKQQHAEEVAQLKADYETELQSLTEKFSEDIAVLEGQMTAETTQHEEFLKREMALLTQKVESDFTNKTTFINSMVQELQSLKLQIIQLEKSKFAMHIKLGDSSDQGTENAISILHADLEQLIKERDGLKKMTVTLRYLLGELVAYFTVCEDELNSTLIGELLRVEPEALQNSAELSKNIFEVNGQAFSSVPENTCNKCGDNTGAKSNSKNGETSVESTITSPQENDISMVQDQVTCDEVSMASHHLDHSHIPFTRRSSSSAHVTHRVHFAPDASSIISLIDEDNLLDYIERNKDLSMDFRSELDNCLERLKAEAMAVLGLSGTLPKTVQVTRDAVMLLEEKVNILSNQLAMEVKEKDELLMQLENSQKKERECSVLQDQLTSLETIQQGLESDLKAARTRVTELESELGKKEDVTEGFGESIQPGLIRRLHNMAELQDKARSVLGERTAGHHKSPHLQLIEELCQEGDRLSEEARKERDDLQQQVEAADKQLRATRLFLEEQAAEREQERDDFLREIAKLQEQIRERDHDHSERERLIKEVESLELQVKEAASLQKDFDMKREELETELKAAVDKIWVLRDIIGELESQVETKTQHEATLEQQLCELHAVLEQQSKTHQELAEELDSLRLDSGKSELTEHINHLEEQLQKHRLHVEQFHSNSTAVRQMKAQLRDLEAAVDKKTKDLESYHATLSSASCSSPSEDVSIREQLDAFRCDTPEEARNTQSPVCLPLDELHRLQDKLQRHSRAEEVALKRIRDLEMQLKGVKKNEEDVVAERDVLQEHMEEQLLKISALQSRLDEQRRKADSQLKEANSELQTKVCDQEKELNRLRETIESRDQEVKELKTTLQETRRIMVAQEREWHIKANEELETTEKLRETCEKLKAEKHMLKRNSRLEHTFGLRDEMRHQKSDITEGMLSLDRDDVLYTSPREVVSGSEVDLVNSNLKTMLIKKDSEIMSLKNQLAGKLELEQERCTKLELELQRVQQKAEELESAVEKEKQLGQQKIEIEKGIIQELKRELLTVEGQQDSLNAQLIHVREQLSLRNSEMEAMERRVCVLQEADVQRQRERHLDQEEMDKNRQELQKAQSLQVKLELEQERCGKLELELQRVQQKAEELESAVEKEKQLGQQKIEIEKGIIQELKRELLTVEGQRDSLNAQLIHVREQLGLRNVEMEAMERRVCVLQEAEVQRQRERHLDREEMDKNRRELQKAQSFQVKLVLEQERCGKLELELRRVQRKAEELESAVMKDKQLGQQKVEIEKGIIQELKRDLLTVEGQRDSFNAQLVHVREQLSLRNVEMEAMERKIRVLKEAEVRRQRKRLLDQEEMDRKRQELQKAQSLQFDLEQKIVNLEQEVSRLTQQLLESKEQVVSAGLDQDTAELRQEVQKLKQDLEDSRVREQQMSRECSSSPEVPSPVLEKLKNVNVMLEQHVTENAEVALTLSRLTEERQRLQARIKELEEQLKTAHRSQVADETDSVHVAFATERALWAQEKAALKLALAQAEADAVHGSRIGGGVDMNDRVQHLFGKYLRSESYRKALVWQKRYLLVVLGGYQESEAITVSRLAQLSGVQEAMLHQRHPVSQKKPRTKFKTAAIVMIALSRMRYLVQRWRLGRRVGSSAVLSRGCSESTLSSAQSSYHGPRRRGSSTSVSSLGIPRAPAQEYDGLLSPPSRDRPMLRRWETDFVQHHMRSTESIPVSPVRPYHVGEFVDRFDQLQRNLGLGLMKSPP